MKNIKQATKITNPKEPVPWKINPGRSGIIETADGAEQFPTPAVETTLDEPAFGVRFDIEDMAFGIGDLGGVLQIYLFESKETDRYCS